MMKRIIAVLISAFILFSFASCSSGGLGKQTTKDSEGVIEYNTVSDFDFSDYEEANEKNKIDTKFVNKDKGECYEKSEAKQLALKELRSYDKEYKFDSLRISYDKTEGMWMVEFISELNGTDISVCVDQFALTHLMVKTETKA